ncbi:IPT/TIG domain-containing protein [Agrococcus jejuensis]|uniref:IPT/TIG domain-containing protein n=1 Tax=Agrococcus jejuensis TaxID=399736 RepID=A0A1G8AGF8_9MICO|nr:IPT/TIG domain-containing protein [Agrococcus jejuensis]SDH20085.1 IPT/TIG domain-containing protein [Agrococcus jejuensis]
MTAPLPLRIPKPLAAATAVLLALAATLVAPLAPAQAAAPTASTITPSSGALVGGETATITGVGFLPGITSVTFGGTTTPSVVLSATQLILPVPAGAVAGPVDVVVSNAPGESAAPLTYTYAAPTLVAADTVAGAPSALTGTGWRGNSAVTVQLVDVANIPVPGASVALTTTGLGALPTGAALPVPAGTPIGNYTAVATDPAGNAASDALFVGFPVPGAPVITAVTPGTSPLAGSPMATITGTNLTPLLFVSVNGLPATTVVQTPTAVSIVVPAGTAPGPVPVQIFGLFGLSNTVFLTYAAPTASASGPATPGGSTLVSTSGWNALVPLTAQLRTPSAQHVEAPISVVTNSAGATDIVVPVPASAAPGTWSVLLSNGSFTATASFEVAAAVPTSTALSPSSGPVAGGQTLTVTGTGFAPGITSVTIDGFVVAATVLSSTALIVTTPAHTAGPVPVVVQNPGGASTPLTYTYAPAPTASSLTPDAGPIVGGATVQVTGTGFTPGASVMVGGVPVVAVVGSSTSLSFTAPPMAPGPVSVVVTTPGGTSAPLVYRVLPSPLMAALSPSVGSTAGGDVVTVTGSGFDAGTTQVTVDGTTVPATVLSPTSLTFVTPAHAAGSVPVVLSTAGGQAPLGLGFGYFDAPTISSLSPDAGTTGSADVTISGSGFTPDAVVTIDGLPIADVTVESTETIAATLPAHAAADVSIVVTTPIGSSEPVTYRYLAAPTVASVEPGVVSTTGGVVALVGTDFQQVGTIVTVDGSTLPAELSLVLGPGLMLVAMPPHAEGAVPVTVTTPGGTSAPVTVTYVALPTLASLAPASGPLTGGTTVVATGTGFVDGATEVHVDGAIVPATIVSATEATFVTPVGTSVGDVDVVVTTAGQPTAPVAFSYDAPTLTASASDGAAPYAVAGSGWRPNDVVTVSVLDADGFAIASTATPVTTTADGAFPSDATAAISSVLATGVHGLVAVDANGNAATSSVELVRPTLTMSSPVVRSGAGATPVTITTEGWEPFVGVSVEVHSDPIPLGTFEPDATGAFALTLPTDLPVGSHSVVLTQVRSDGVVVTRSFPIEVEAVPVDAPTPTTPAPSAAPPSAAPTANAPASGSAPAAGALPRTGADASGLGGLAIVAAMLVAAGALMVRRRVTSHR